MRVTLTRNVRRDIDFINGMDGVVESYDPKSKALNVLTDTGFPVPVYMWTDPDLGDVTYYPVMPAYATTILKYQGAELKHVVAYLDVAGVPGAAYTAISRVSYEKDFLVAGKVTAAHFRPQV